MKVGEIVESEITDIFEGGYVCTGREPFFDDVLKKWITEALKRKKALKSGEEVSIQPGASQDINCKNKFYQFDFSVYRENEGVRGWTVYGMVSCDKTRFFKTEDPCDVYAEIFDVYGEFQRLA
ncbi:hypothetical protein DRP07_02155 [Archaeoglobales archaeon]|nr:MAG: hypothetical protein DRP07_02155 [Archaeoglobales archaeon]